MPRRVTYLAVALAMAIALVGITGIRVSPAKADGTPNITFTKSSPSRVLYGQDAGVTLTASNPGTEAYGYNLSFRDVLPAGVSYVSGSAPFEPTQIANAPNAGETTLIWENLSDLSPGSSYSLGFSVRHDTTYYEVGAGTPGAAPAPGNPWGEYSNTAGAYINDDPRFVPDFAPGTGLPMGPQADSYTGFSVDSATTEVAAFIVEKGEPNAEGEILRGLHDHQTVYTVRVRNNSVNPTDGFSFTDYLPAGLEFLACGAVDNTADAPTNTSTNHLTRVTPSAVTAGTFTLGFDPGGGVETTASIPFDATAATIQAALEALPSVLAGELLVTDGPLSSGYFDVEHRGRYGAANNTGDLTSDDSGLTGTTADSEQTIGGTGAEEYPSAPLLDAVAPPATTNCVAPDVVDTETVDPDGIADTDPDNQVDLGVYTRVEWQNLVDLTPGQVYEIQYVAAVPIRENTETWSGGSEPATTGLQAANLDNNSGPETSDEQPLTNYLLGAGTYNLTAGGTAPTTDDTTVTRTAEDISVHKSVGNAVISQGDLEAWSLLVETSEYRVHRNIRLEDTVPDGLCPLGENVDHEPIPTGECLGGVGDGPTISTGGPLAPYTSVIENADGTWTLVWDDSTVPELDSVGASSSLTIDFRTRTRAFYQQNGGNDTPVLARDSWTNTVDLQALDYVREENGSDISADELDLGDPLDPAAPDFGDPNWAALHDPDSSAASQQAGGPSLDKAVAQPGLVPFNCDVASATYFDGPAQQYGPGDHVCWKLRVDFLSALDTGSVEVKDFLPPSAEFVPGSMAYTPANNLVGTVFDASAASSGVLTWTLGTVDVNAVFEATFRTTIVDPDQGTSYDIGENLMKMSYLNTDGQSFPLRDLADFEWGEAELDLVKGVMDVNNVPGAGNPQDTDDLNVQGGDVVTYRVDLLNAGSREATSVAVWDRLPSDFDCSMVGAIFPNGGACATDPVGDGRDYIQWDATDGITVAAETNGSAPPTPSVTTLTYDVAVPAGISPNTNFDNEAGVISYESATNAGPGDTFTYVPAGNMDPGAPAATTTAADDDSRVSSGRLEVTKTATTEVDEAGNDTGTEATIGEEITYTLSFTVPEGVTIYDSPRLEDVLDSSRLTFVSGSATATMNGGALPVGVALDSDANMVTNNTVALLFTGDYTNSAGSGDDVFQVVFRAQVADTSGNNRLDVSGGGDESSIPNQATLTYDDTTGTLQTLDSNTTANRLVEPNLQIVKNENDDDDVVEPLQSVDFSLAVSNVSGTRVSTAHNLTVVDIVPPGMTVTNPGTGTVNLGAGPSGEDTITWTIASLAPGASQNLVYTVRVDPGTVGDTFVNDASVIGTSLPNSTDAEGERTSTTATGHGFDGYEDDSTRTLNMIEPTIVKGASTTTVTIGQDTVYTVTVTIPAGLSVPDATVIDTLPEGLTFDGFGSATAACTAGCPPDISPITNLGPQTVGSTTRVGWFLGDVDGTLAALDRAVTITYRARPADEAGNVVPESYDNAAGLHWNPGNGIAGTPANPDPTLFTETTGNEVATVTLAEPGIALDKSETTTPANDGTTDAGDIEAGATGLTYTLRVENTGTSGAYDVRVTDLPGVELTNVSWTSQAGITQTQNWSAPGDDLEWVIAGPIAPGAGNAATISYTADLRPATELDETASEPTATPNDVVINTADVAAYYGVAKTAHDADTDRYREYGGTYGPVSEDTVTLVVNLIDLQIDKTTGATGFPDTANAELLQPFDWRVVVTNNDTVATANGIDITDVLPPNWDYVANSGQFTHSADGAVGQIEPSITPAAGGDTLTWTDIDSANTNLGPGESLTLVFQATPQLDSRDTPGLSTNHVNTVRASAEDAGGASGSGGGGIYATGDDTAEADLRVPVLTLIKTPDGDPVNAGGSGQYTIVVQNTGPVSARNVTITDALPGDNPATTPNIEGVTYTAGMATAAPPTSFSEDATGYNPALATSDVVWTISEIAAGNSVTITIPVVANTPQPDGSTLLNSAAANADEFRPPDITADMSDDGSLTIGSAPDFATDSTKTSNPPDSGNPGDPTDVNPTDRIDYTIHYENDGNANATGVVVIDVIPTNTTYVLGSATSTPTDPVEFFVGGAWQPTEPASAGDVERVRWLVGAVNAPPETTDLSGDLGFSVTVDRPLPNGTVISNTATLTSDQTPGGTTLGPVSHEVASSPNFGIVKAASDRDLVINDDGALITYSITLANTGDENATNVVVSDGPPTGTALAGYDAAGASVQCSADASPGPYTYGACGADLASTTRLQWTLAELAVDTTRTLTMTVRVPRPFANGTTLDNTADIDSDQTAPTVSNTEQVTVTTAPRVRVTKSVNPQGSLAPGQELTYTLAYVNDGSQTASNVVLSDPIPAHASYVENGATGSANFANGTLTWNLGDLAVDETGTVSFRVRINPVVPVDTSLGNTATIRADGIPAGTGETTNPIVSAPTIDLEKKASGARANKGALVTYTLTATLGGNAPAAPLVITDRLPKGLKFVRASDGGIYSNRVVTWRLGTRQPGKEVTVSVTTRVTRGGAKIVNSAEATTPAAAGAQFRAEDDFSVLAIASGPTLTVRKRGAKRVRAGKTTAWRIVVTNRGPDTATKVWARDRVPPGFAVLNSYLRVKKGKRLVWKPIRFRVKGREVIWNLRNIRKGQARVIRVQMAALRTTKGKRTNRVTVGAKNVAPPKRASAGIRVQVARTGVLPAVTG